MFNKLLQKALQLYPLYVKISNSIYGIDIGVMEKWVLPTFLYVCIFKSYVIPLVENERR